MWPFPARALVEDREGPEEIAGVAALVGVADELRVELLVPLNRDAALLLVILLQIYLYVVNNFKLYNKRFNLRNLKLPTSFVFLWVNIDSCTCRILPNCD